MIVLPARVEELERVRVEIELLRVARAVEQFRQLLSEEESEQQMLRTQVDERIGPLRDEIERLRAEIERGEQRLERLAYLGRGLSDDELDREQERVRADEAAWWAEWRHQRENQHDRRGTFVPRNNDDDVTMRQLYRTLARLVHPDLARDSRDRAQRETVMRMANEAKESRNLEQLRRLLSIWARADEEERPHELEVLRARVAQRRVEIGELRRELNQLRRTSLGRLLRRPDSEIRQYIRSEELRLRRELATYRMRRRRVLRLVEDRRRDLSVSAGE